MDAISLSVFSSRIEAICDEMGAVLKRVAFSPNIKDRLDFSCAIFDAAGELCAQAAHIPVHLGSMAYAMRDIVASIDWHEGDMVILNDPYLGGTHLPDVTVIAPLFVAQQRVGFVVNRAHHADIGAESPGSMPISKDLYEEGQIIPPTKIMQQGEMQQIVVDQLMQAMRNPVESMGDFTAQISANKRGLQRLKALVEKQGVASYQNDLDELNRYAQRLADEALSIIPAGEYFFEDVMDDDGMGNREIAVKVKLIIKQGQIKAGFSGTSHQVAGNINCPLSVAAAAVYYVFRCLMPAQTPACAGTFKSIIIEAPEACLLNANRPAAVAAGNVETSTRIVDVVMGALAKAIPEKMAAASHGSMNNIAMGSIGNKQHPAWDYYETIGGGMGASINQSGLHGVQTHMTNTLNTPVEALEMHYPVRINQYALRKGSGGEGQYKGGDGLIREYEFLAAAEVTLLTERRTNSPWGLQGSSAMAGANFLNDKPVAGKVSLQLNTGDRVTIKTPGGGGASS